MSRKNTYGFEKIVLVVVSYLCCGEFLSSLSAQETDAYNLGLRALNRKDFAAAVEHMDAALPAARDKRAKATVNFYAGLARQQLAKEGDPQKAQLLVEAGKLYERAVELEPIAGGGLNNLAEVLTDLGRFDEAEERYKDAINLGDHRQSVYLTNYAQFLAKRDRSADAIRMFELAIEQHEDSKGIRDGILGVWRGINPDGFIGHVWKLQSEGRPRLAVTSVLEALEAHPWSDRQSQGLLSCLAASLAQQRPDPATFLESDAANLCRTLSGHEQLGRPMTELLSLYSTGDLPGSFFGWWPQRLRPTGTKKYGLFASPERSFLKLINSMGDTFRDSRKFDQAEMYYQLAFELNEDLVDADALVRLADMWIAQGPEGKEKLGRFFKDHEHQLFEQKGTAIFSNNAKRAYEIHRSLALIYVHLEKWGSEDDVRSAVFQLNAALADAERFNRKVDSKFGGDYIADQRLATTLSDWYRKNGDVASAFQNDVKYASHFNSIGYVDVARELIEQIPEVPFSVRDRERAKYQELSAEFAKLKEDGALQEGAQIMVPGLPGRWIHSPLVPERNNDMKLNLWVPNRAQLSEKEISEVMKSIQAAVKKAEKNSAEQNATHRVRLLPIEQSDIPTRIKFDGRTGSVFVKGDDPRRRIEFSIKQRANSVSRAKFDISWTAK